MSCPKARCAISYVFAAPPVVAIACLYSVHLFQRGPPVVFPGTVADGDIVKGLPVLAVSAAGVYASHAFSNISPFLEDFARRVAGQYECRRSPNPRRSFPTGRPRFSNSWRVMYLARVERGGPGPVELVHGTLRSASERSRRSMVIASLRRSAMARIRGMRDYRMSLTEVERAGSSRYADARSAIVFDKTFRLVEDKARFIGSCAVEARNP